MPGPIPILAGRPAVQKEMCVFKGFKDFSREHEKSFDGMPRIVI